MTNGFNPTPKRRGDLIRSRDWNETMDEVVRLGKTKLDAAEFMRDPLTIASALVATKDVTVGTAGQPASLSVSGTLSASRLEGDGSALTGIEAGKWSDMADGQGIYYNDGKVGIGTDSPPWRLTVQDGEFVVYNVVDGQRKGWTGWWNQDHVTINAYDWDGGQFQPLRIDGSVLALNSVSGGNVGIGTATPGAPLHVASYMAVGPFSATGGQGGIDLTGDAAELGLVKRTLTAWPEAPAAGDRFVWYNPDGTARLWTHNAGDLMTVTSDGTVTAARFVGDGSGLTGIQGGGGGGGGKWSDSGDGGLYFSGGDVTVGWTTTGRTLRILNRQQDPQNSKGDALVLGAVDNPRLRMGYAANYSWVQAGPGLPLALNPQEGHIGIGTATVPNPQGWNRVVDILGTNHARLNVRSSGGVITSMFSHVNWNGPRGVIGTESDHPLTFATKYTHHMTLDTDGSLQILSNSNPVRFTSGWSGFPDSATNQAEISNDTGTYQTLMIVGNKSAGNERRVSVWDRLEVNGTFAVSSGNNVFSYNGAADIVLRYAGRGSGGRAIVHDGSNSLTLNYGNDFSGGLRYYGTLTQASSRSLKENIATLSSQEAAETLKNLSPVKFTLKSDETKLPCLGFVAEEAPDQIASPDRRGVINSHVVAILTKVVQDQQHTIAALAHKLEALGQTR